MMNISPLLKVWTVFFKNIKGKYWHTAYVMLFLHYFFFLWDRFFPCYVQSKKKCNTIIVRWSTQNSNSILMIFFFTNNVKSQEHLNTYSLSIWIKSCFIFITTLNKHSFALANKKILYPYSSISRLPLVEKNQIT